MAIGSFTMPATRTRLRGISRVHQAQRNARPGCFVGKVHPQLVESPGVPFVAVFAASHCPIPDAGEVFQGQCLARYDGFVYQGLGNAVIDVFHVAALPSTHLFEATFGRFGADPLQGGSAGDVATAGLPHGRARKVLPGTVCCDMDQTQVDADSRAIFRGRHAQEQNASGRHAKSRRRAARPVPRRQSPRSGLPACHAATFLGANDRRCVPARY